MEEKTEGACQYKKGLWSEEEDKILSDYVKVHGKGQWNHIAKKTGLKRCGKSCRLRWMNYLSPNVKHGHFTQEEEDLIIRLHNLLGNRWSLIAKRVPGRTDNQVKNYWNTHLTKRLAVKDQNGRQGVRKKSGRVGVSGSANSRPVHLSKTATSDLNSSGNTITTTENTLDKVTQEVVEVSDNQETLINDSYVKSFWISDDLELDNFSMEFLDGVFF